MRAAIYSRKSTDDPDKQKYSHEEQIESCERHAKFHNLEIVATYKDDHTGKVFRRKEMDRCRLAARKKEFDVLLVYTDDRLARKIEVFWKLFDGFEKRGIDVILVTFDLSGVASPATRRFLLNIKVAVSQFEADLTSERTVKGLKHAAKKGIHVGQPPKYFNLVDGVYRPSAALVEMAKLKEDDWTYVSIAVKFNDPHPKQINRSISIYKRWLKREQEWLSKLET